MVQTIKSLTSFNEIIEKDSVSVVDFYATWCGPCTAIAPFVEKLSLEYADVNFLKIDVDEASEIAAEYSVRAMPTFKLFRKGEQICEVVGANPAALKKAIQSAVSAWLAGEPVKPFEKPPTTPTEDFLNTYGRFIFILIAALIWYFRKE